MTLLFLGENLSEQELIDIVEFTRHASSTLSPFSFSVDRRGLLGKDDADVLFFGKSSYDMPRIAQYRDYLLKNDAINKGYLSSEQYPDWTPHLTMGYPETPAVVDNSEYSEFTYVDFDRIAVWVGDSTGPEFQLRYTPYSLGMDVDAPMAHAEVSKSGHDLIFFEKRSTPKVIGRGKPFIAPKTYGKQTRRRPATPDEEKIIARGDWLRVDQSGNKGGAEGYKKTRMVGREHLVKHVADSQSFITPLDALKFFYNEDGLPEL